MRRTAPRNHLTHLGLLLAGAFFGMALMLNCGGGGSGGLPADAGGGSFGGVLHVSPDDVGPQTFVFAPPDPRAVFTVRSVLFTPQGPNDVLLAVMAEGSYSGGGEGVTLALELYLDNVGDAVARQTVTLAAEGSSFLIALPFHGGSFRPGGSMPAGSVGVRAEIQVPITVPSPSVTIDHLDFKLVGLEDLQVDDPSSRIAPNPSDVDGDMDGYTPRGGDCDDGDDTVYPGAVELDDGKDNDCDGTIDEGFPTGGGITTWYRDEDEDGWGRADITMESETQPPGFVARSGDCADGDASVHPEALDVPGDGIDNDCDGQTDEPVTWYRDKDEDGYGNSGDTIDGGAKPAGYTHLGGDCDDNDASVHPWAAEVLDGKDNDCDGQVDE